ncbi:MAG: bifunctional phosphoribosylaminoimidazolecarboxamide formyltransferase/IMP cyclohydrolase [Myxococcales bacterium]|nr:bifunctional phosphoribosylaminoimidazolecarboxamide formyltransferase/IMP cyclohydrolase [Myxococcales bacterium]
MPAIRRALISVSDKRGLIELVTGIADYGVEILSTGGTAKLIAEAGFAVTMVSDYTGAPEILDGRVKTLHPKIHGGLLGRPIESHETQMKEQGIEPIDLVVVNLYPFEETVASGNVSIGEAIEKIDIGGPSMLRSAAKNHERVAVLADPSDYQDFVAEMKANDGAVGAATRFELARKVFAHTAAYDGAIAAHLSSVELESSEKSTFPATLTMQWERVMELRYGENPHQGAAFYRDSRSPLPSDSSRPSIGDAEILQGKALSYNNILDLDAALACCVEHKAGTAVVVKHTNPCGVAWDESSIKEAYLKARSCDPTSSFGGIVAVNQEVDEDLAGQLVETFLECVVAPSYSESARTILSRKKNLRLVALPGLAASTEDTSYSMRSVSGGILVQASDFARKAIEDAQVVSKRQPSPAELASLDFAWRVVKHVKSNAILFCQGQQTAAIGAGQMSRVDAAKIAVMKAQMPLQGSVVASDAFFPFRDGVDALAEAGAVAVIQPGGSVRDEEVIAAADEHGMAMVFTGMRHFRH